MGLARNAGGDQHAQQDMDQGEGAGLPLAHAGAVVDAARAALVLAYW